MKRLGLVFGVLAFSMSVRAELPDVTEEAVAELGVTPGTPQMNGFVFIDGRYLPPPYTVTRKGNGIFINRIQVEQPVPWSRFTAGDAAGEAAPAKKAVDADGDFEQVGAAAAKSKTAAPDQADEPAAAEPDTADPVKPKVVKSIDDLFDDDVPAKPAPAAAADAVAPTVPPVAAALSPEEIKRQKETLVANLERMRKGYEQALIQNEVFFFGQRHNRVNGNYGTARTLMGVLPKALRNAQSPQDLLQRLNEGGVYFLDQNICSALFKFKGTFPLLEERLKKILEAEELDALKRKPTVQR